MTGLAKGQNMHVLYTKDSANVFLMPILEKCSNDTSLKSDS